LSVCHICDEPGQRDGTLRRDGQAEPATIATFTARDTFRTLWDVINQKRATWASNPFVWCVSFRTIDNEEA